MRMFLLVAAAILPLAVAEPAFSQGVLLPGSANATPPPGTVSPRVDGANRRHRAPRPRRAARHPATPATTPAAPSVQSQ